MKCERGFTLVELMISLVLLGIVIGGIMTVAVTMTSSFREQRTTISGESAARNSLDFIADAIRSGSPAVSSGNIQGTASSCPDAAEPVVVTDGGADADELVLTFASGSVVTSTRTVYGPGASSVVIEEFDQFREGDTILITDLQRGVLATIDDAVTSSTLALAPQGCATLSFPGSGYPVRSLVLRATRARFYVAPLDDVSSLWMDPDAEGPRAAEPLAEGIEDLQIALARDANDDGVIAEVGAAANDDEWQGNVAGEADIAGAIRAVRITLVARASPTLRRTLSTTVEIRNLKGSR
jgi:prepilin-type N-terminal cleavage/methylation domain-containing protein